MYMCTVVMYSTVTLVGAGVGASLPSPIFSLLLWSEVDWWGALRRVTKYTISMVIDHWPIDWGGSQK